MSFVRLRLLCAVATVGLLSAVTVVAVAPVAGATAAGPSRLRIPGNFIFLSKSSDGRCGWGVGIEYPSVPKATGYAVEYWDGYWQATEYGTVTTPVPHTAGMTKGMNYFGITGGNGPAPCAGDSTDGGRFAKAPKVWATFAHKPKKAFITGMVTDRDDSAGAKNKKREDSPVEGAEIKAYDGKRHYSAVSGPGGIYFMEVKPGSYRVVPDDSRVKHATFTPTYAAVHVKKDETGKADFRLKAGLDVKLDLSKSTVPADGMHVVHATVTTTRYGKPASGTGVVLTVEPKDENSALTAAPKVAMCGDSGRLWPTGPMSDTDSLPVTISTNAKGVYHLTLSAGSVPGHWSLEAWGKNDDGALSSDAASASETKTLDLDALKPTTSLTDFTTELDALKAQVTFSSADPSYLATTLAGLAAKGPGNGVRLGGLAFNVANSPHGTILLVSSAADAPRIASDGTVRDSGPNTGDLVLDPAEWNSLQNGGLSLLQALQAGEIKGFPTLTQWESGKTEAGWTGASGMTASVPNQNSLQQFGWSYGTTCG